MGAVFIDLCKAFDTLSHSTLLSKLPAYGIADNELELFTNYLFGRQQVVLFGSSISNIQLVLGGVPQGSILAPLLFIIFYNDFVDYGCNSHILMYADDMVIYCAGKSIQTIEMKLTQDLKDVASYFDEKELVINLKKGKTEVMLFGTAKRLSLHNRQLDLKFRGISINNKETYTYLGHILDKSLTLRENFDRAYKKCCNRLKLLSKLRYSINSSAALRIYQTIMQPVMHMQDC